MVKKSSARNTSVKSTALFTFYQWLLVRTPSSHPFASPALSFFI
jgi:hypothetical protein